MKDILLITPPFTQLNTPYPATSYLKGFLNTKNISSYQMDLGLEVILKLFSKQGLTQLFNTAEHNHDISKVSENAQRICNLKQAYISSINSVIEFLQGKQPTMAQSICNDDFLPQASRFKQNEDLEYAFGNMGIQDKAKHLATLYLEDISDFIIECIDENFGFSRYAEKIGRYANTFDEIYQTLISETSYINKLSVSILDFKIKALKPKLVCFSVPFAGNLLSAFRCAQYIKLAHPEIKTVLGGGFPNTELRNLSDTRVFEFFDYITLDDGELPLELIFKDAKQGKEATRNLKRTFVLENNQVVFKDNNELTDYKMSDIGTPDYSDLQLANYISVIEVTNPMHSLWSDGRWNKLTMTHGCYWAKCTFCDTSLAYIKDFDPLSATQLADKVEKIMEQTGTTGFHFVDEAAHPALMKSFAIEVIRRNLKITWWTNIRFEKSFTYDLCQLLKASGCIAVSGGLEVASDRLLGLINKGVTVEQVAKVTDNLTQSGIMVHAYLMYGYPSQTAQETIDSLEMVRQLFEQGCIQSGFWHQFALTAHSPIIQNPDRYGIIPEKTTASFAYNDVNFKDKTNIDHSRFSFGLKKSIYNYMLGLCYEYPLQEWFDFNIPRTKIKKDFIYNALQTSSIQLPKESSKVIWLGNTPISEIVKKSKKGRSWENMQFIFHTNNNAIKVLLDIEKGEWLIDALQKCSVNNSKLMTLRDLKEAYENQFDDFELFWHSKPIQKLRSIGLLAV